MMAPPKDLFAKFSASMESLGPWGPNPHLAIAFSGGPDSMALLLLAHQWTQDHRGLIHAFHVDHCLRATSTIEAESLQEFCNQHCIPFTLLTWHHEGVSRGIQSAAREARYALLLTACKEYGILHLLTAHHQDDQQETLYMRATRNSGPKGMEGIRPLIWTPQARVVRPLLSLGKKELLPMVEGHPYIQDPSNENNKYRRVQIRQELQKGEIKMPFAFANAGQNSLSNHAMWDYLARHTLFHPWGFATLEWDSSNPGAYDGLLQTLQYVSGNKYMPGSHLQVTLREKIKGDFKPFTLHNCLVWRQGNKVWVGRENRHVASLKLTHPRHYWDNRFLIESVTKHHISLHIHIKPLGQKGYEQIYPKVDLSKIAPLIPYRVLETLPCFWIQDKVVGCPFLKINLLNCPLPQLNFIPHYDMVRFTMSETK